MTKALQNANNQLSLPDLTEADHTKDFPWLFAKTANSEETEKDVRQEDVREEVESPVEYKRRIKEEKLAKVSDSENDEGPGEGARVETKEERRKRKGNTTKEDVLNAKDFDVGQLVSDHKNRQYTVQEQDGKKLFFAQGTIPGKDRGYSIIKKPINVGGSKRKSKRIMKFKNSKRRHSRK